jgi:ribose transport system substrate-binding protein
MKGLTRLPLVAAIAVAGGFALTACGAGSSSSGGDGTSSAVAPKSVAAKPPASGCGSYTAPKLEDPNGLVAALPPESKARYDGYPFPIRKSPWANWKPKHGPPYKVGIQWSQVNTDFQQNVTQNLRKDLAKNPDIGEVTFQSTGDSLDVTAQLQQLQSLIRSGPDIIVLQELQPNAFVDAIDLAGKRGIPVIVVVDSIPESKYAIGVQYNPFNGPARVASVTVRQMGGKGNVLMGHTIPGIGVDTQAFKAFDAVLKNCPDIKQAGAIYGNFVNATAKAETLKFLATHPQKIDGVLETAAIAQGIMSAFDQSGRPVPSVADIGASKGSLAYWKDNFESYRGSAGLVPEVGIGVSLASITNRMLAGQGAKFSEIVGELPLVTDHNVNSFVDPSWTFATPGDPPGERDAFLTEAELDQFFTSPKAGAK